MIDISLLEEIVTKAIPFEQADCKRIKAKKEWRREQLKEQILAWHKKCNHETNKGSIMDLINLVWVYGNNEQIGFHNKSDAERYIFENPECYIK